MAPRTKTKQKRVPLRLYLWKTPLEAVLEGVVCCTGTAPILYRRISRKRVEKRGWGTPGDEGEQQKKTVSSPEVYLKEKN
jgi:nitrate reductase gamma subunit